MVTQKDVARLAGVSFMTVSRVINNKGNVRPETRRRVEEAIRVLGYSPSFVGKALNQGRTDTVAIMTPARFDDTMGSLYLMRVIRGISLACRQYQQDILLSPLTLEDPSFDYLRPYRQRKVDGLIYVGLQKMPQEVREEINRRRIPCVVIGDRPEDEEFSWVDTDNERAGYDTVMRIWKRGHRRICFVGLREEFYNANIRDREKGYRRAMKELTGEEVPDEWVWRAGYHQEEVAQVVECAFSSMGERPTALFCATDEMALGALVALRRLGLRVPEDVSVVGFDGFLKDLGISPTLASNEQPLVDVGRKAAEILYKHICNPAAPRETHIFPVYPLEGETLQSLEER
ncbi:LacI family DNA-binding transcriptional regulator [Spirochaeta thermophila]|uniref:Glucose-resistance amylase regulator n=1 Tax=Winmispira thermophila (strain ATCC 49972 / DSM 6192 / RI 19.B1) TaxID=665571 RepID=E0RUA8_WINT6|nr:LacI family DNA-binding transcriptional regulator [Spirochaeta thermophila]ADN02329.1 glucose-resistance amylase regulator [Spirochaeta thermophila DSM 6192]